jgi:hypothetical protein
MCYRKRNNCQKNNGQTTRINPRTVRAIVSPGIQGQTAPVRKVEQRVLKCRQTAFSAVYSDIRASLYSDGYGLDDRSSIPGRGKGFLSSPQRPDRLWDPPIILHNLYLWLFSPGVNRPDREADHSLPSFAVVKNSGGIPPLSHTSTRRGA